MEHRAWTSEDLVELAPDHPGFNDREYRSRRNAIARISVEYDGAGPVPDAEYTAAEHGVWRDVWRDLAPLHLTLACDEYLACTQLLEMPEDRIPQLREINERLEPQQGFRMHPVGGLIQGKRFLRSLGQGVFLSTQYVRHHSRPFYTPEPDVIHELIGHAATLADPFFARLSREFGEAARRSDDPTVLLHLERLYWFTLEFGVVDQGGPKAYGAGLLSSIGELGRITGAAELRPFDIDEIVERDYDPTDFQPVLFVVDDIAAVSETVVRWLRAKVA